MEERQKYASWPTYGWEIPRKHFSNALFCPPSFLRDRRYLLDTTKKPFGEQKSLRADHGRYDHAEACISDIPALVFDCYP